MFVKLGELIEINGIESVASSIPAIDPDILENFQKIATSLKKVAPKAEDFLYFSAVMMHAAEAAAINDDGTFKLNASGQEVNVGWDKSANTWKWVSNDPRVLPYRNSNGDIFPEEELVKAYKKWVGKPLCVDHQSSSVEHVRGFIVDTYYDRKLKRVVALCALDKAGYPQLARQVSTGVSTNVSMGTAVGKAICAETGCATVARTESDFCQHMRHKSGYGEINVDLNPIELSIVVNGADPKANIKNVLAAANSLHAYVKSKEIELNKTANKVFNFSLSYSDEDGQNIKVDGTESDINNFRSALDDATKKLEDINASINDIKTDGVEELAPNTPTTNNSELAPPQERFASLEQLNELTKTIESKLSQMKNSLDKLANNSKSQEDDMSKNKELNNKVAYPLGTVEPTKYPVDPASMKARNEDKHMVGVDNLGAPDQLAPGDLERKKMLLRAETEGRQLRRAAVVSAAKEALNKQAYPLGTEEPTTYPKDKLNEEARNKTDKQMVGKSPFPGVGKVDELYPEDKKKKEMLNRASLSAKFVSNANKGQSAWNIYSGEDLVLTASVDALSGGRSDLMFDSIATKDFGKSLLVKVRKDGADSVSKLLKKAQMADMPADVAVPPVPEAAPVDNMAAGTGDPATVVRDLAAKLRDLASDLGEAVNTLVGEVPEMGEPVAEPTEDMVAAANDENLVAVRNGLGHSLVNAMRDSIDDLNKHAEELDMINGFYEKGAIQEDNKAFAENLTEEAIKEAKESIADGFKLVTAFVKFARGNAALTKKAQMEEGLNTMDKKHDEDLDSKDEQLADDINLVDDSIKDLEKILDGLDLHTDVKPFEVEDKSKKVKDDKDAEDKSDAADCGPSMDSMDTNDLKATMDELKNLGTTKLPAGTKVEVTAANLSTKAARAAVRAQLAAEAAGKDSHSLQEAHPKGGMTPDFDVKPSGDLGKIETIDEVHDKMMALVNATPKVRKEAENLHRLVVEGAVSEDDFDDLISEGLDADAVAYYKKYFGEVDGGKEFAAELVKEHTKASVDAQVNTYKIKIARAYELAYDMVERGLCSKDRPSVTATVNEILAYNDEAFDSLKKVVARHNVMKKEAGVIPQVGQFGGGDSLTQVGSNNLYNELDNLFSNSKRGAF